MAKVVGQSVESIITSTAKKLYKSSVEFKESNTQWNHLTLKEREKYRDQAKKSINDKSSVPA